MLGNRELTSYRSTHCLLFMLVTGFSLFAYGIDVDRFLTYNLFYSDIISNPEKYLGTPLQIVAESPTLRLFHESFGVILRDSILNSISAVVLGILTLYVGFLAVNTQTSKEMAFSTILIIGTIVHGYFLGLDSSGLVFDRKAIVFMLLIGALFFFSINQLVAFSLAVVAGIMIHPLDMVSGLAFILPGCFLFVLIRDRDRIWRVTVVMSAIALVIVWQGVGVGSQITPQAGSISDWYRFSLLIEVGDVALFDYLRNSSGINGSLLLISSALAWQNRGNLRLLDCLCLTFFPLTIFFLALEWMHTSGLAFGLFSEAIIALQLRRGFWLVSILSLAAIILYVLEEFRQRNEISRVRVCVVVSAILVHSIIGIIAAALVFLRVTWGGLCYLGRCSVILGIGLLFAQLISQADQLALANESIKFGIVLILTCVMYWVARTSMTRAVMISLFVYSSLVLANNNVRHRIFEESWQKIAVEAPTPEQQLINLVKHGARQVSQDQIDALTELNKFDQDQTKGVLFASAELGYIAPVISNQRFIFSRWDNTLMFQRTLLNEYQQKLDDFGVSWNECEQKPEEGMACFLDAIQARIEALSEKDLERLADKYAFQYVIRRSSLDKKMIYKNREVKIFQLSTTQD